MLRLGGDGKPKRLEVRLSIVDQKLGNAAESNDHMKRGQQQYSALGWKDISPAHLRTVVAHYDQVKSEKHSNSEAPIR